MEFTREMYVTNERYSFEQTILFFLSFGQSTKILSFNNEIKDISIYYISNNAQTRTNDHDIYHSLRMACFKGILGVLKKRKKRK